MPHPRLVARDLAQNATFFNTKIKQNKNAIKFHLR
jgi:hypothetical protein